MMTNPEQLKSDGMELTLDHSDDHWLWKFESYGRFVANRHLPFTSEDILTCTGKPPSGSVNAIGAAMNALAKRLKLVKVGYVKSTRTSRHAGIVAQWRMPV